jgi:hypothetical protein
LKTIAAAARQDFFIDRRGAVAFFLMSRRSSGNFSAAMDISVC